MADTTVKNEDKEENRGLYEKFKYSHRIRIYRKANTATKITLVLECYNEAIIRKHGWCQIADETRWGICSQSCQFIEVLKDSKNQSKMNY